MKIKKFKARNFSEALELVKKELSPDAVILSSEEKKGLRPFVEVTAAVDYENEGVSVRTSGQVSPKNSPPRALSPYPSFGLSDSYVTTDEIKSEIERLRETIEGMRNNGYELTLPQKKKAVLHFLRERAIQEEFALRLCERARDLDDIPSAISSDISTKDTRSYKKAVIVIGPTGVGKTTTIAKLSAKAIKEGKKVAMISFDNYRIGAIEQIRIYAKIMGIPLSVASSFSELRESLSTLAKSRDVIFVDTTGRNPMNESYIEETNELCRPGLPVEVHLLISANSDDSFMTEAYRFYKKIPIDYVAFTKIDESVRFGSLYNLLLTYRKPLAYITTGQTVPDDIEFIDAKKLSNMILTKGCYKC